MPKEQWIIKNQTNRYLSVGDLQKLPALWPGKVIDLLIYYEQDALSNSKDLKFMIGRGWLDLTKKNGSTYESFNSSNGESAITTAEENEVNAVQGTSSAITSSTSVTLSGESFRTYLVDASSGNITISLPSASDAEDQGQVRFKKVDATANKVILDPSGSETIDGELTAELTVQYDAITLEAYNGNWFIL